MALKELRIFDPNFRFGAHVIHSKSITKTIKSQPCGCCQLFLTERSYQLNRIPVEEEESACKYCLDNDVCCYVHCPYIINLASSDSAIANRGVASVKKHLEVVKNFPCSCVLHIGAKGTVETVAQRINDMNIETGKYKRNQRPLLLEVSAGQGTSLGKNETEIRKLFEAIDRPEDRVGLCLDTQHLFASGMCDFQNHESVVKVFEQMTDAVGTSGINLIHLNDSEVEFGSKKDRHTGLGIGHIWHRDFSSLCSLIGICRDIDLVLETQISAQDLNLLSGLYEQSL